MTEDSLEDIKRRLDILKKRSVNNEQHNETEKEDKRTEEKPKKAIVEETERRKTSWGRYFLIVLMFSLTAVFMFWINKVTTPDNSILIMVIVFSVLFNVIIIMVLIGTGIGIELVARFINKFRYKSGNYVNSLHIMKSGVLKERFIKKDIETGIFRMVDKPYVTNPKLLNVYKGIPTYVHREGNPDPLNIWEDKLTGDFSNSEMDIAMNSKGAFDVKAWLEKNKMYILIIGFAVIVVCIAGVYFGWQNFQMLRDGTFKQATKVICSNIQDLATTIQQTNI